MKKYLVEINVEIEVDAEDERQASRKAIFELSHLDCDVKEYKPWIDEDQERGHR